MVPETGAGTLPRDATIHIASTLLVAPRGDGPDFIRNFNALWAKDASHQRWVSIVRKKRQSMPQCQRYFRNWDSLPRPVAAQASLVSSTMLPRDAHRKLTEADEPVRSDAPITGVSFGEIVDGKSYGSLKKRQFGWLDVSSSIESVAQLDEYHHASCPVNLASACDTVGEAKFFTVNGASFLYTYGRLCNNTDRLFDTPRLQAQLRSSTRVVPYMLGRYKNVVYQLETRTGSPVSDAIPMTWEVDQAPTASKSDKNFLLFDAKRPGFAHSAYAITLIYPHRVYWLDLAVGAMQHVATTRTRLPFTEKIGLSGGPVRLDDGTLLVAAHVRRGSKPSNATRMTFFYACEGQPPFAIKSVTPVISFDWSRHLEYCNGIDRDGDMLRISLGVADCGSVLLEVPLASIVAQLQPLASSPSSRSARTDRFLRWEKLHRRAVYRKACLHRTDGKYEDMRPICKRL